jgi:hypothetical protein
MSSFQPKSPQVPAAALAALPTPQPHAVTVRAARCVLQNVTYKDTAAKQAEFASQRLTANIQQEAQRTTGQAVAKGHSQSMSSFQPKSPQVPAAALAAPPMPHPHAVTVRAARCVLQNVTYKDTAAKQAARGAVKPKLHGHPKPPHLSDPGWIAQSNYMYRSAIFMQVGKPAAVPKHCHGHPKSPHLSDPGWIARSIDMYRSTVDL